MLSSVNTACVPQTKDRLQPQEHIAEALTAEEALAGSQLRWITTWQLGHDIVHVTILAHAMLGASCVWEPGHCGDE